MHPTKRDRFPVKIERNWDWPVEAYVPAIRGNSPVRVCRMDQMNVECIAYSGTLEMLSQRGNLVVISNQLLVVIGNQSFVSKSYWRPAIAVSYPHDSHSISPAEANFPCIRERRISRRVRVIYGTLYPWLEQRFTREWFLWERNSSHVPGFDLFGSVLHSRYRISTAMKTKCCLSNSPSKVMDDTLTVCMNWLLQ